MYLKLHSLSKGEVPGEVLLTCNALHFVQQGDMDPEPLFVDDNLFPLTLSMSLESLQEVLPRWYQLNDHALELFFDAGVTKLFAFSSKKHRDGKVQSRFELQIECFRQYTIREFSSL